MAPKGKSLQDMYTSQALLSPTESGANTLTFEKLETGLSVYDKVGWIIARIEWSLSSATLALFNGTTDVLNVALTMSNNLSSLSVDDPANIIMRRWQRTDLGTAASGWIKPLLHVDDFSTLPGGGLLTLPSPLYGAILGQGLSGAAECFIRLFFQAVELSESDYFNLIQARQLLIST